MRTPSKNRLCVGNSCDVPHAPPKRKGQVRKELSAIDPAGVEMGLATPTAGAPLLSTAEDKKGTLKRGKGPQGWHRQEPQASDSYRAFLDPKARQEKFANE